MCAARVGGFITVDEAVVGLRAAAMSECGSRAWGIRAGREEVENRGTEVAAATGLVARGGFSGGGGRRRCWRSGTGTELSSSSRDSYCTTSLGDVKIETQKKGFRER